MVTGHVGGQVAISCVTVLLILMQPVSSSHFVIHHVCLVVACLVFMCVLLVTLTVAFLLLINNFGS